MSAVDQIIPTARVAPILCNSCQEEAVRDGHCGNCGAIYANDGKCHNAEPGTFNHECGKPAMWIGTKPDGFRSGFCDRHKEHGWEARDYTKWERLGAGGVA